MIAFPYVLPELFHRIKPIPKFLNNYWLGGLVLWRKGGKLVFSKIIIVHENVRNFGHVLEIEIVIILLFLRYISLIVFINRLGMYVLWKNIFLMLWKALWQVHYEAWVELHHLSVNTSQTSCSNQQFSVFR